MPICTGEYRGDTHAQPHDDRRFATTSSKVGRSVEQHVLRTMLGDTMTLRGHDEPTRLALPV
jgi:hypothetical protein